jgi:hypothetical protein
MRRLLPRPLLIAPFLLCLLLLSPRPASADGLDDLQALLQGTIDASGFTVAVAVTDLQTGETASVRGDEQQLTGCTINLLVLIQATLDMQAGLLTRDVVDAPLLRTIQVSDPHYARYIVSLIGGGDIRTGITRVRDLISRLGVTTAVFDHPPAYDPESISIPVEPPAQVVAASRTAGGLWRMLLGFDPYTLQLPAAAESASIGAEVADEPLAVPDNIISPIDMNRVLSALWHNQILSPEWTAYLLERMTRVSPGLQYLVGSSGGGLAVVSHKNGYFWTPNGYTDNDVGIVRFKVGGTEHAYAVSYYASNLRGELADAAFAQRLMGVIWNYFQQRY